MAHVAASTDQAEWGGHNGQAATVTGLIAGVVDNNKEAHDLRQETDGWLNR